MKNENEEQTTGFASKIIRVPQENVIPLLKNTGKDLFVRQTQRANQELMQTKSEGAGAEENYVIRMPVENMLMEAQRALTCQNSWDKQMRLGARVGPAGWRKQEDASTIRVKDSTRATEEFWSGRLGPLDRYPTPRRHCSSRMRSGTGQVELESPGR